MKNENYYKYLIEIINKYRKYPITLGIEKLKDKNEKQNLQKKIKKFKKSLKSIENKIKKYNEEFFIKTIQGKLAFVPWFKINKIDDLMLVVLFSIKKRTPYLSLQVEIEGNVFWKQNHSFFSEKIKNKLNPLEIKNINLTEFLDIKALRPKNYEKSNIHGEKFLNTKEQIKKFEKLFQFLTTDNFEKGNYYSQEKIQKTLFKSNDCIKTINQIKNDLMVIVKDSTDPESVCDDISNTLTIELSDNDIKFLNQEKKIKKIMIFEKINSKNYIYHGKAANEKTHLENNKHYIIYDIPNKINAPIKIRGLKNFNLSEKQINKLIKEIENNKISDLKKNNMIKRKIVTYKRRNAIKKIAKSFSKDNCQLCFNKAPFESTNGPYLEIDHIIPLAQNGHDELDNVIALCPNCHAEKTHHKSDERKKEIQTKCQIQAKKLIQDYKNKS